MVVRAVRRFTAGKVVGWIVMVLAVAAAADLGITAIAVFVVTVAPAAQLVGDVGTVLAYFTFYPSVLVAALTLLVGALMAWRAPDVRRLARAIVATGILSAVFVALALIPQALR